MSLLLKRIIYILTFYVSLFTFDVISQPSITWQKLYDGLNGGDDEGYDICQTNDGNYCIVGTNSGYATCIKINQYGDTIWKSNVNTAGYINGFTIAPSQDGGCIISGGYDSAFAAKFNSNGQIIWKRFYGNSNSAQCWDIKNTNDGGYIICGKVNFGDAYIMKINSTGNLQWQRTYATGYAKVLRSIEIAVDGGFVATGNNRNFATDTTKALVMKIDSLGNFLWEKLYKINNRVAGAKVIKKSGSYYIISGGTADLINPLMPKMFFMKLNINGDSIYVKTIDTQNSSYISLNDFIIYDTKKYIIAARLDTFTTFPYFLAKAFIIDTLGFILKQKTFITGFKTNSDYTYFGSIQKTNNGDLIFAGDADFGLSNGFEDIYCVRTDSNLSAPIFGIQNISNEIPVESRLIQNYPNPFNPKTKIRFEVASNYGYSKSDIKLTIYNILGNEIQTIAQEKVQPGIYEVEWNASQYSSGIYYCVLTISNLRFTKKMILLK